MDTTEKVRALTAAIAASKGIPDIYARNLPMQQREAAAEALLAALNRAGLTIAPIT